MNMYQLLKERTGNEAPHTSKAGSPRGVDNRSFPREIVIFDESDCDISILSLHLPYVKKGGGKLCTTTTDPATAHSTFLSLSESTEASDTTTSVPDEIVNKQSGQHVTYDKYKLLLKGDGWKRKKEKPISFWRGTPYYNHDDDHIHSTFQFSPLDSVSVEDFRDRVFTLRNHGK
jgi:hypothetical protein